MLDSAQIGDRVVMKMDKESRYWRGGHADGTMGTIVGRYRGNDYHQRNRLSYGEQSGVYQKDGAFTIKFDGIEELYNTSYDVELADKEVAEKRRKEYFAIEDYSKRAAKFNGIIRVSDLPETKFYEGDLVKIVDRSFPEYENCVARVAAIEYHWEGVPYQIDWINRKTGEYAGRGHTYLNQENLSLIERGNHWREAHGEPLIFRNLLEEGNYALATGRAKEMRNPAKGNYSWTKEEVLEAISEGIVDGFLLSSILNLPKHISAYHFDDRDLGERIREETLQGFEVSSSHRM